MKLLQLAILIGWVLMALGSEDQNNRSKRQQSYFSRRGSRPPPYAVQMEPIVQYSQRDPLYNPLASSKSDDYLMEEALYNAYGPEPIIEIIIKESNESLPTPPPQQQPQTSRSPKEPIQVFYVKYENKDQPDGKKKVVYDPPVPALTPHEDHEEIKSDNPVPVYDNKETVTPAPQEPSTTLRTIIRPESEIYHSGGSGIRVTFGTEQIPPNNHNKRSDIDGTKGNSTHSKLSFPASSSPASLSSSTSSKREHGPFPPHQGNIPRSPTGFPQQRIINSIPPQHQLPPSFGPQPQFQSPQLHLNSQRQQRPPITIQGLPELHQRLPFQSFNQPHRVAINHQQSGFPPAVSTSHQNIHLQNQPPFSLPSNNFNDPHAAQYNQQQIYKQQQEQEKQRYHDQRRQQEFLKQREQQESLKQQEQQEFYKKREQEFNKQREQELNKQREQQRQQEIQRQQDYQRHQFEQLKLKENKLRLEQQQIQQNINQNYIQQQQQQLLQNQNRVQQQQRNEQQKQGEILKSVPKLEQHYAIRENPLNPGPFPQNSPVIPQYPDHTTNQYYKQQTNSIQQQNNLHRGNSNFEINTPQPTQPTLLSKFPDNNQQYYSSNLEALNQYKGSNPSIWGTNVYKDIKQKIFATPITNTDYAGISSVRPVPINLPTATAPPSTTTTTTTAPTTTTTQAPTTPVNQERIKANIASLPDEVPEDIREQLLSSGILGNADIQILDYDKIGDIPIENLPPEHLANFYGAGGGSAVSSASEPIPTVAKQTKLTIGNGLITKKVTTSAKVEQSTLKPGGGVEMKVVRFDPNTAQGQAIADQHIRDDATHLKPVTVGARDDSQYNRYLPLKISGTSFPIPDVPELKDRKISSVVVLAPVEQNNNYDSDNDSTRQSKKLNEQATMKFHAGEILKLLVKKPTAENYKKWLEHESKTQPQEQSVILLVTISKSQENPEKEIFMYDVTSQSVNKLSGDLSSAFFQNFVDAAENNSGIPDTIDDFASTR